MTHKLRHFACDGFIVDNDSFLLVKRRDPPFKGTWVLPAGMIEYDETAEQCVAREMKEETNLNIKNPVLIKLYSDPKRDLKRRTIAALYLITEYSGNLKAGDDALEAKWCSFSKVPKLGFDHNLLVKDAISYLKENYIKKKLY